jgi:hypothetical protein
MAVAVAGCSIWRTSPSLGPALYVPDAAGVVVQRELVGKDLRFELDGGGVVTFLANADYLGGSQPAVGDLLLTGATPQRWVFRATYLEPDPNLTPPDCYRIFGTATADATQVFQTVSDPHGDVVIAFAKATGWTDVGRDSAGALFGVSTCINPRGEATARLIY